MWATSVMPILVSPGLSVLDLGPMYATDVRQTSDVRQHHRLMTRPIRGGSIITALIHNDVKVLREENRQHNEVLSWKWKLKCFHGRAYRERTGTVMRHSLTSLVQQIYIRRAIIKIYGRNDRHDVPAVHALCVGSSGGSEGAPPPRYSSM